MATTLSDEIVESGINEPSTKDMRIQKPNVYQKFYDTANELKEEKTRNEMVHREFSAELKARQNQIERQTSAIAHLNNTIRAKDALIASLAKDDNHHSLHVKLDALLARK